MGVVNKRKHTSQFKFEVAMKAIQSKQMAEVARVYGVNTGQVSKWVSYLKAQGASIFSTHPDREKAQLLGKVSKLEQLVGKKEVELSLMKNFLDFPDSPSGK
jgi:transposase